MGPLTLTWLGQAGFVVDTGETKALVDPFLSDYPARRYPPPPLDGFVDDIDVLFSTHEHLDHLDVDLLPTVAQRSPHARLVLPAPIAPQVEGLWPAERVDRVRVGDRFQIGSFEVTVTPAWHGIEVADAYTDGSQHGGGVRFVGYVLRSGGGRSIWHTGDTILTEELVAAGIEAGVDVALVPINGRTHERERAGLVGNTSFREAVELAQRVGASTLVPIHWDMFAGNTEWPGRAVDEAVERDAELHILTLARYRPFSL